MLEDYIVWYKECEDSSDVVRGMARNYKAAEEMAYALYLRRVSTKDNVFSTGVTKFVHGELYEDNKGSMRWEVIFLGNDVRDS
jgi:hypothetical protein